MRRVDVRSRPPGLHSRDDQVAPPAEDADAKDDKGARAATDGPVPMGPCAARASLLSAGLRLRRCPLVRQYERDVG